MGCVLSMSRNVEFNSKLSLFKESTGLVYLWHNDNLCGGQIDASRMELTFSDHCRTVPSLSRRYSLEIMKIDRERAVIRLLATAKDNNCTFICCGRAKRRVYIDVDFELKSVSIRRCRQKEHKRIWMPLCTPVLETEDCRLSQNEEIRSLRLRNPCSHD